MKFALLFWLLPALALADASSRLAPTPDGLHRERTAALEQRVARLLTALPGVQHVELALTVPFAFAEPLDAPASPTRATVVLVGEAPRADVLRVLQSALPNLSADAVTLIERTPKASSESSSLVQIGPFRVHPSSAVGLRAWLTISLIANVLMAGFVLSRLRRA